MGAIVNWLAIPLMAVGAIVVAMVMVGAIWAVFDAWEDAQARRRQRRQAEVDGPLRQPVGSAALDDPATGVWTWWDGTRWHTERRQRL